ncbi:MAG: hypothetical protein JKX97_06130 [Candidatus Lindowbacteria bacterium]|nr:hypothetical protein [Candidatus Lindowbacteria bacterium]
MTSVAIRVDASREQGFGNFCRSILVAEALTEAGHRPTFFTLESSMAPHYFAHKGIEGVVMFSDPDKEADVIMETGPGIVIFDVGPTSHKRLESFKEAGVLIVTFDDLGDGRYLADLVVDTNLDEKNNPRKLETTTRYLLGPDYAIFSRACMNARDKRKKINGVDKVIVTCGGSDPSGATPKIVEALGRLDTEVDVEIVVGPGFSHGEKLNKALLDSPRSFSLVESPDDLPLRMRTADIGIISGGLTLFEASYLGLPSIVISQNNAQEKNVGPFAKIDGVIYLGLASSNPYQQLLPEVKKLTAKETRNKMSKTVSDFVDGKGVDRFVHAVQDMLGK